MSLIPQLHCISAAPAALDRYLAALPAMSLIPFAPFAVASLPLHRTPDVKVISMHQERLMMSAIQPSAAALEAGLMEQEQRYPWSAALP